MKGINYTTIGPSDQDSNLKFFLASLNSVCIHFGKKSEEIEQYFHFYFFIVKLQLKKVRLLNFNHKKKSESPWIVV